MMRGEDLTAGRVAVLGGATHFFLQDAASQSSLHVSQEAWLSCVPGADRQCSLDGHLAPCLVSPQTFSLQHYGRRGRGGP